MADISIALNRIQDIKTVNIEGVGVLRIRKVGSGEDLDLAFKQRRINKLINDLSNLDFTGLDARKKSDRKEIEKLSKKSEKISDEIEDIKRSQFDLYKNLLSDDENGRVVDIIMNTLTDRERAKIFELAFGDKSIIDADKNVSTEVVGS